MSALALGCGAGESPLVGFVPKGAVYDLVFAGDPSGGGAGVRISLHDVSARDACREYYDGEARSESLGARLTGVEAGVYTIVPGLPSGDYLGDAKLASAKHEYRRGEKTFEYLALGGNVRIGSEVPTAAVSDQALDFTLTVDVSVVPNAAGACAGGGSDRGVRSPTVCECVDFEGHTSECLPGPGEADCCPEAAGPPYRRFTYRIRAEPCPYLCEAVAGNAELLGLCEARWTDWIPPW